MSNRAGKEDREEKKGESTEEKRYQEGNEGCFSNLREAILIIIICFNNFIAIVTVIIWYDILRTLEIVKWYEIGA